MKKKGENEDTENEVLEKSGKVYRRRERRRESFAPICYLFNCYALNILYLAHILLDMHIVHCSKRVCELYICWKYDILLCLLLKVYSWKQKKDIWSYSTKLMYVWLHRSMFLLLLLFLLFVQLDHLRFKELKKYVNCSARFIVGYSC